MDVSGNNLFLYLVLFIYLKGKNTRVHAGSDGYSGVPPSERHGSKSTGGERPVGVLFIQTFVRVRAAVQTEIFLLGDSYNIVGDPDNQCFPL